MGKMENIQCSQPGRNHLSACGTYANLIPYNTNYYNQILQGISPAGRTHTKLPVLTLSVKNRSLLIGEKF
jgi:hypothetical protein